MRGYRSHVSTSVKAIPARSRSKLNLIPVKAIIGVSIPCCSTRDEYGLSDHDGGGTKGMRGCGLYPPKLFGLASPYPHHNIPCTLSKWYLKLPSLTPPTCRPMRRVTSLQLACSMMSAQSLNSGSRHSPKPRPLATDPSSSRCLLRMGTGEISSLSPMTTDRSGPSISPRPLP